MNNLELSRRVTDILPEGFCGFKYFMRFAASSVRWCHAKGDFGKILFWTAMVGYRQPPNFVEHASRDIGIPF